MLTARSRVILEKLTGSQLVRNYTIMEPTGSLALYKSRPPVPVLNSVGDFSQNENIFCFNNYEEEN